MDKSNRVYKVKSRLQAAEGVLKKCEEKLEQVERVKTDKFSDAEMTNNAKLAAEGLDLNCIDELRSMKLAPPPVVELVARCVCTLASGDDVGDVEHRVADTAKETSRKKKVAPVPSKGPAPKQQQASTEKRALLTWEESQKVLARSNFKERISNFDGRMLLDNQDLVNEVKARIDLKSIDPSLSMAQHMAAPKRSKKERNDEAIAAVRRREAYNEGVAQQGQGSGPLLTLDDARYVSKIAPPLLVWIARVIAQHTVNEPMWRKASLACAEAVKKRDEAKDAVVQLRKKSDEIAKLQREEKARAKAEKERAAEEDQQQALQELEEEKKKKDKHADKARELMTPDKPVLSGPTPNIFFQNGRISGIAPKPVQLSPRLQLPTVIHFFIRVKHCRVTYPFPPSMPEERYLHKAQVIPGYEEAGPVAHVPFDGAHVIGLYEHEHLSLMQLVLEVPSTPTVNPAIQPIRLSFHPRHNSQLHCGSGGAGTIEMPRIIVTAYPWLVSRHEARIRAASAPPRQDIQDDASVASEKRHGISPAASVAGSLHGGSACSSKASATASQMTKSTLSMPVLPFGAHMPKSFVTPGVELVPPLSVTGGQLRSIGSAYRSMSQKRSIAAKANTSPLKARATNDEQDWSRVAIALTARAQAQPFALSRPGQQRPIPDILLRNSAVAVASAKRLTRSPAKVGLEYLREVAVIVGRVAEGYIISASEKRRLREAADLEAEIEKVDKDAEALEAAARAAAKAEAEKATALQQVQAQTQQQPFTVSGERSGVDLVPHNEHNAGADTPTRSISSAADTAAAAEAKAKEAKELEAKARDAMASNASVPDPATFGKLFDSSLAATAALAVGAAASPAAASLAQDAFATAVEATSAKAAAASSGAVTISQTKTPPRLPTSMAASAGSGQASARSKKGSTPRKGSKSGDSSSSGSMSARGKSKASPRASKPKAVPALSLTDQ